MVIIHTTRGNLVNSQHFQRPASSVRSVLASANDRRANR
jgi:hypothetical protein